MEKLTQIMLWTGMSHEEAQNSWAYRNFEEAKKLNSFFDAFINEIRATLPKETPPSESSPV